MRQATPFYAFARFVSLCLLKCCFRFEIHGREHLPKTGPCLIVANHASYLDPPVVGGACPRMVHFLARHDLEDLRGWGPIIRRLGIIPIKQQRPNPSTMKEVIRRFRAGEVIGLFPEGGRTPTGALQAGRQGAGFLIAKAKVPVVPAYIEGTFEAWPITRNSIRFTRIRIFFGPPRAPQDFQQAGENLYRFIVQRVMDDIARLNPATLQGQPCR